MKSFFATIISLLFPETCVVCKKENVSLCENCIQNLPAAPFLQEPWMHALFSYQDTRVRNIIHALKFKQVASISKHIAPLLHQVIQDIQAQKLVLKKKESVVLLPVPRMQTHVQVRGFDAVLYLAQVIAAQNKNQYIINRTSIIRTNTRAQVGLSREERLTNMKGAFKITDKDKLYNRTIFIIDDVTTTGSTLQELRNICLEAGAKEVFALTIAH